jgi:hypothetical protein
MLPVTNLLTLKRQLKQGDGSPVDAAFFVRH